MGAAGSYTAPANRRMTPELMGLLAPEVDEWMAGNGGHRARCLSESPTG